MKRFLRKITLIAATAIAVVSCSKSGNDYAKMIPADVPMVFAMNGEQLMKKSGYDQIISNEKIQNAITSQNEAFRALVKNPSKSGIDFSKPIYFSVSDINSNDVVLTAAIKNKSDVKAVFETKTEKFNDIEGVNVFADENIVAIIDGNNFLIYASNRTADEARAKAISLAKQTVETSILSNEDFVQFSKQTKDIDLWVSYDAILKSKKMAELSQKTVEMLKGVTIWMTTEFNNGDITMDLKLSGNKDNVKTLLASSEDIARKVTGEFLAYVPDVAIATIGMNFSGSKWLQAAEGSIPSYLKNDTTYTSAKQIIEAIDGEVTIAAIGMEDMNPSAAIFAQVNNTDFFNTLLGGMGSMDAKGNFTLEIQGMKISAACKDGKIVLATNQTIIDNVFAGKKLDKSILSNALYKNITDTKGYIIFDINSLMAQPIAAFIPSDIASVVKQFSSVKIAADKKDGGSVVIGLNNKNKNSLAVIADMIIANN